MKFCMCKKPFISSIQSNLNLQVPSSNLSASIPSSSSSHSVPSSIPHSSVSSSVSSHSIPSLPQPQIIRAPRCVLEGCTLTRQKAIFIKLKERSIKLCAFSHLKEGLSFLKISYPNDYFQISGSVCFECEEVVDYFMKLSETSKKECQFELV